MMTKTTMSAFAAVLAALLSVTPPAKAADKKTAVKIDPAAQKYMSEGLGRLQRGEYDAAISALTKAVRKQGSVSSYFLLGWAHYQRGFKRGTVETADRDDAQAAADAYAMATGLDPKLTELTDPSRLYFSLALCEEAVESYDRALEAYKAALAAAPAKAMIPAHAARLRLKMHDEQKAVSNLEMAIEKAREAGKEDAFTASVRRDPAFAALMADAATRRVLGVSRSMVAAIDARGEEMRDAVSDAPARTAPRSQDPAVADRIAQGAVEFNFRRYQAAISAFNEALAINQERMTLSADQIASVYEKIGASYNKLGQTDQAIRSLQKSLQQNPMSAGAHYQIALAYAMSGKSLQALHALKESLSSASGSAELRRLTLLAKTDAELEAVRDLPGFASAMAEVADRVALR